MRQKEKNVIALDVSAQHIKALLGSFNDTASHSKPFFELQGIAAPSSGVSKKGPVQNKQSLSNAVAKTLSTLGEFSGYDISEVRLLYTHPGIRYIRKTIGRTIKDQQRVYITEEWLRLLQEKIQSSVKKEYRQEVCVHLDLVSIIADGEEIVHDPYEYSVTQSLRIEYVCLLAPAHFFENILESIERYVTVRSSHPTPITNKSFLSNTQQEQGGIVCDIGAELTNITIYKDGILAGVSVVPFGGNTITNEIALLKKISMEEAEEYKLSLTSDEKLLKKQEIQKIERRVSAHIKELILPCITAADSTKNFPGGIVLIGGGAQYANIETLMEKVVGLYAKHPKISYHIQSQQRVPQTVWHSAYGLLSTLEQQESETESMSAYSARQTLWKKFLTAIQKTTKIFY